MRLAYRVKQVGNERIVTSRLQPGTANRDKNATGEELCFPCHGGAAGQVIVCSIYREEAKARAYRLAPMNSRLGAAK
jgi:hypothetical protein